MPSESQISQRKIDHIDICARSNVESRRGPGFDEVMLCPKTLPELSFEQIQTQQSFLNFHTSAPIFVTGMTGGVEKGTLINDRIAEVCAKLRLPMGLGSQKIALENPELAPIFSVKNKFPDLFLMGNLGLDQILQKDSLQRAQDAINMIHADALCIHSNVLQELIQPEGDRNFMGILSSIEKLCKNLTTPIIFKEVGCGIDENTAKQLISCGVSAIDVGGRGGTSWAYIESLRYPEEHPKRRLGELYRDWGISTKNSITQVKRALDSSSANSVFLTATGGIRSGLDVVKSLCLGARFCGIGLPIFKAALISSEKVEEELKQIIEEIKMTMLLIGKKNIDSLNSECLMQTHESV